MMSINVKSRCSINFWLSHKNKRTKIISFADRIEWITEIEIFRKKKKKKKTIVLNLMAVLYHNITHFSLILQGHDCEMYES